MSLEIFSVLLSPRTYERLYFLFNSVKAAQEVAYTLRGKWDGCNGVEFLTHDYLALKLAAELCDAEYCAVSNNCHILDNLRESDNIREARNMLRLGFSDTAVEVIAAQINCRLF